MEKMRIVRMEESDGSTWLDYINECDTVVDETPELTIVEVADVCDQNAESINHHGFVGAHRILAALLYRVVGESDATKIMVAISEYGGLDGMNMSAVFAEFGIKPPFDEWELSGSKVI